MTVETQLVSKAIETNGFGYGIVGIFSTILLLAVCYGFYLFAKAHFEHVKQLEDSLQKLVDAFSEISKSLNNNAVAISQANNQSMDIKNILNVINTVITELKIIIEKCKKP